ncbi:BRO1 domain-containing protein BROX-like isoform X2 [Amphiura filiformis]|uniref:BRO1 domain-containing protein BROX-like isoform X2 n=1 Tax=Amphiura filiformis TaxID=82378 RepID=UPI003B2279BC
MAFPGGCSKQTQKVDFTRLMGWPLTNCWSALYKATEELNYRRNRLLSLTNLSNTKSNVDEVLLALDEYYRQPMELLVTSAANPHSVTFHWSNLVGPKNSISHSVAFERASMILRVSLWLRNQGHRIADYELIIKAASLLLAILELNVDASSPDLNADHIKAMIFQFNAEILVMKIFKMLDGESNPSYSLHTACNGALMASINVTSAGQLIEETFERAKKWKLYLLYKYELYIALGHLLQSKLLLNTERTGEAVSSANAAQTRYKIAETVSKKCEKTTPRFNWKEAPKVERESRRVLHHLQKQLIDSQNKNENQYKQQVPKEAPKLDITLPISQPHIDPQVTTYHLPQIDTHRLVVPQPEEDDDSGEGSTSSATSSFSEDYVRVCCPCCGPCIQGLLDGIIWLLKAPFKFILWAAEDDGDEDGEKRELTKNAESDKQ